MCVDSHCFLSIIGHFFEVLKIDENLIRVSLKPGIQIIYAFLTVLKFPFIFILNFQLLDLKFIQLDFGGARILFHVTFLFLDVSYFELHIIKATFYLFFKVSPCKVDVI